MMVKKTLVIIDGNSLIYRSFHALPNLTNKNNEAVGALYGFTSALFKVVKELRPNYLAVCFDTKEITFRRQEFKEYKAKRPPTPKELVPQITKCKQFLEKINISIFEKAGFEADDLIATILKKATIQLGKGVLASYIVTGDFDALQLVDDDTKMYILNNKEIKKGSIFNDEQVVEKFGVRPNQITDLKTLAGDSSDNVPGIQGIGKKTAVELLSRYQTIEGALKALGDDNLDLGTNAKSKKIGGILGKNQDRIFFMKSLIKMRDDVDIDFTLEKSEFKGFDETKTQENLKEMGFTSLISRVPYQVGKGLQSLF